MRAQYVIAADGAQSRDPPHARRRRCIGPEAVYDSVNVLLNADLRPWTAHRPAALYFVEQPRPARDVSDHQRRRPLGLPRAQPDAPTATRPSDFTPERSIALIRQAVGVPDLPVKILGVSAVGGVGARRRPLRPRAHLPGRRRRARDAADGRLRPQHRRAGRAQPRLEARRGAARARRTRRCSTPTTPSASRSARSSPRRASPTRSRWAGPARQPDAVLPRPEFLNEQGLIFGATYESAAVIPDGTPPPARRRSRHRSTCRRRVRAVARRTCGSSATARASRRSTSSARASCC